MPHRRSNHTLPYPLLLGHSCLPAGRSEHLGSLLSDDEDDLCDPLLAASLLGPGPSLAADLMPMPTADLGFNFAF